MIELRKQVERIVRPIRASNLRKDRMREELLVHLTTIYDEERAQQPDNASGALAAAVERFGDPDVLRAELQAGVPRIEQVVCTPWEPATKLLCRRPGETTRDFAIRSSLRAMQLNGTLWSLLVLFIWALGRGRPHRAQEASLGWFMAFSVAFVLCLTPAAVFGQISLSEAIWRAWESIRRGDGTRNFQATRRVLGCLTAAITLYAAILAAMLLLITRAVAVPLISNFWFWAIILMSALLGVALLLLQMPDVRRWDAWEGLVLDEPETSS